MVLPAEYTSIETARTGACAAVPCMLHAPAGICSCSSRHMSTLPCAVVPAGLYNMGNLAAVCRSADGERAQRVVGAICDQRICQALQAAGSPGPLQVAVIAVMLHWFVRCFLLGVTQSH